MWDLTIPGNHDFYIQAATTAILVHNVSCGVRVLGHFPDYVNVAKAIGAKYFSVPDAIWNSWTNAEQWAANQKFLDRGIAQGDTFRLATPVDIMRIPSYYADEINHLLKNGYTFNSSGDALIPKP
jgi:hypothetical protein